MTSAYQPTTEPEYCESLESIDEKTTCNPMQRWGSGKRQREMDQERDPTGRYTSNSSEEKAKDESSGRCEFADFLSYNVARVIECGRLRIKLNELQDDSEVYILFLIADS